MAEETIGSGTRAEREEAAISRVPPCSLEEQEEMERRRMENIAMAYQGKEAMANARFEIIHQGERMDERARNENLQRIRLQKRPSKHEKAGDTRSHARK